MPARHRTVILPAFVAGLVGFFVSLFPLTDPALYGSTVWDALPVA